MTVWLLRFVPDSGGQPIDARYKTEGAARDARSKARNAVNTQEDRNRVHLVDDFGLEYDVLLKNMSWIILDPPQSMKSDKALNDANHIAAREAGVVPKERPPYGWPGGSSLQ